MTKREIPANGNGKNGRDQRRKAKEKLKHSFGDATSFFSFFFLFMAGRIFLGILGLAIGTLLLIIGSWSSSARIGVSGITQEPWPGKQIEDQDYVDFVLGCSMYGGWVLGFVVLTLSCYLLGSSIPLYKLMFDYVPWNRNNWSNIRKEANSILVESKVREETLTEQFNRMTQEQQDNMRNYLSGSSLSEPS